MSFSTYACDLRRPQPLTRFHNANLSPSLPLCSRPQTQRTVSYPNHGQASFVHVSKSYPSGSTSISQRSQLGKNMVPFSHGGLSAALSGLTDSQHGGSPQLNAAHLPCFLQTTHMKSFVAQSHPGVPEDSLELEN